MRHTSLAVMTLYALSGAVPCRADAAMPVWNMQSFCTAQVPAAAVADCVRLQQEAGRTVRGRWGTFSAADKEACIAYVVEDDIPPSYVRLQHCLEAALKGG